VLDGVDAVVGCHLLSIETLVGTVVRYQANGGNRGV
jgi:hypothetical protein